MRTINSFAKYRTQTQLIVLPPSGYAVPGVFKNQQADRHRGDALLADMQRFRGRIYLEDGAITSRNVTADGRHKSLLDEHSWHVLSLDVEGKVCACVRFLEQNHARGFDDLWVRHAAATTHSEHGAGFRAAVEREISGAREMGVRFGEVGGWAVSKTHRLTTEPLRIILATYGLLELLGSCVGVATATFRHNSAGILRRIGLTSLAGDGAALPPYYDPNYDCQMEMLRFDSRLPNPKYRTQIKEFAARLTLAPVICSPSKWTARQDVLRGFEMPAADLSLGNLAAA